MENNYSVYQHVTPDGMYYFGQTNDIKRRWRGNGVEYKGTALYPYIEKYGWENIQHIVLFRDQTKEDALWIEDFLITTAQEDGVCINKNRSGLISKEEGYKQQYHQKNREKRLEHNRECYQKNREKILEHNREYHQKNREKILEHNREYYQKNRDEINERRRQRYQKNREKILEQNRECYQKNREKHNEYQRKYYQHKKLEKELKEVETTLF